MTIASLCLDCALGICQGGESTQAKCNGELVWAEKKIIKFKAGEIVIMVTMVVERCLKWSSD